MPVEEYEKSKAKQSIERKIQGKAIFFLGRTAFTGDESEIC